MVIRLPLLLFSLAMTFYLFVLDNSLHTHHRKEYETVGRYILLTSVMAGWLLGLAVEVPETSIAIFFAFLAGGVILNVLKEELPSELESRYWAFLIGVVCYSAILVVI